MSNYTPEPDKADMPETEFILHTAAEAAYHANYGDLEIDHDLMDYDSGVYDGYINGYHTCYEQQTAAIELRNKELEEENKRLKEQQAWIPVTERLPDVPEYEYVLMGGYWYDSRGPYWNTEMKQYIGNRVPNGFTHWKHLYEGETPAPPTQA